MPLALGEVHTVPTLPLDCIGGVLAHDFFRVVCKTKGLRLPITTSSGPLGTIAQPHCPIP